MLTTSNSILEESSLIANLNLIMELPLLVIPKTTGSSETLGVNHGEKKDISDLREEILVVLPMLPHTPLFEQKIKCLIDYT